ncbi:hypothetical protein D3C80_2005680 [compost metagenome]
MNDIYRVGKGIPLLKGVLQAGFFYRERNAAAGHMHRTDTRMNMPGQYLIRLHRHFQHGDLRGAGRILSVRRPLP